MISISTFIQQIQKCNPRIYVDIKNKHYILNKEHGTCGVYLTGCHRDQIDINLLDTAPEDIASTQEAVKRHNASSLKHIGYVNAEYMPEVHEFSAKGRLISPGLRETLIKLQSLGLISEKSISKHFNNVGMLGLSDWDRLSTEQKRQKRLEEEQNL